MSTASKPARPGDGSNSPQQQPWLSFGRAPTKMRDGRSRIPWAVKADQDVARLQSVLATSQRIELEGRAAVKTHEDSARTNLTAARDLLEEFRGCPAIRRWATSSAYYTAVLARLQSASEELLYCQSDEALISRIPGLAAAVRTYIGANDTRREVYLTYLQNLRDACLGGQPDMGPAVQPSAAKSPAAPVPDREIADPGLEPQAPVVGPEAQGPAVGPEPRPDLEGA